MFFSFPALFTQLLSTQLLSCTWLWHRQQALRPVYELTRACVFQRWRRVQLHVHPGGQCHLPHFGAEHHGCGHRSWRWIRSWRLPGELFIYISGHSCLHICCRRFIKTGRSWISWLVLFVLQWREQLYKHSFPSAKHKTIATPHWTGQAGVWLHFQCC